MADGTTLYSLASALGGALIGGMAGIYGPRQIDKRRRQHELLLERQRTQLEAERRRHKQSEKDRVAAVEEREKVLGTIAEAVVSLQGWHRLVEWRLMDLDAGTVIGVEQFDETAQQALQAVVRAFSLVANTRFRSYRTADREDQRARRPVTLLMAQVTGDLRQQIVTPSTDFNSQSLKMTATQLHDNLMELLTKERQEYTGESLPVGSLGIMAGAVAHRRRWRFFP